jgi:hypothetical protein
MVFSFCFGFGWTDSETGKRAECEANIGRGGESCIMAARLISDIVGKSTLGCKALLFGCDSAGWRRSRLNLPRET